MSIHLSNAQLFIIHVSPYEPTPQDFPYSAMVICNTPLNCGNSPPTISRGTIIVQWIQVSADVMQWGCWRR